MKKYVVVILTDIYDCPKVDLIGVFDDPDVIDSSVKDYYDDHYIDPSDTDVSTFVVDDDD